MLFRSSKLSQYPPVLTDSDLEILEQFVVLLCDRSSTAVSVDEARLGMFARKQRPYEAIPPTRAGLLQHTLVNNGGYFGQQMHQLHKVMNN